MRTQAVVTKFDDVGLATISGSKIKAVKYTKQEGTLRHFSNLATEIKQLEKIGMTMDEFSKTDLCGHIMEIFAASTTWSMACWVVGATSSVVCSGGGGSMGVSGGACLEAGIATGPTWNRLVERRVSGSGRLVMWWSSGQPG